MYTYQDLLKVNSRGSDREKMDFVYHTIYSHKDSDRYQTAYKAEQYYKRKNVTISEYRKLLYTVSGKVVPDNFSANFKMTSGYFRRFIMQENQHLLGNGVGWINENTGDTLGNDRYSFDVQLQKLGKYALIGGVAFGFWNFDHMDIFKLTEFAPLYDEDNGALMAGVRFWQIDSGKPIRATLYEIDGYTDYIWEESEGRILNEKKPYILSVSSTQIDGEEIYDGKNYPAFPIIPLWGNDEHQSELVGIHEQIDCYDLIKSGFANTVDEASYVYWVIQNAGGMDDMDLAKFVERMKTVHAATVDDDGATAESHSQEAPYASREALLSRLDKDLYRDAMALDIESIASGAATATQIIAAYEPLNSKCDDFEYCVIEFIQSLLSLVGIDDDPTFTRSMIINTDESIRTVVQAASYLSSDYITEKILTILGDGDRVEDMLKTMDADALGRLSFGSEQQNMDEYPLNDEEA